VIFARAWVRAWLQTTLCVTDWCDCGERVGYSVDEVLDPLGLRHRQPPT
jgi:hypothetical protein